MEVATAGETASSKRGFAEMLPALITCLLAFLVVGWIIQCGTERGCTAKAELMRVPHEVRGGVCMVRVDGRWLPLDNVRAGGVE